MAAPLGRLLRHLCFPPWRLRRVLPRPSLEAITHAIRASEQRHGGEIHCAVEAALDWRRLLRGVSPRERALEVFSALRVWDTEANNGVLIYLLLADRDVEIVADRGIHRRVPQEEWERICRTMEAAFREGRFEAGLLAGIEAVSEHLIRHFGGQDIQGNELPDQPTIVRP
ncbi:TPM domain-containing protein [Candidatus Methylocalor cossyra]|uniref:TLP18.3/Psb32/MOLO-1 phosphatase superfamily protein n=1 Tax=Candidatus Methylocalor cossyra TaxID=3108543 RepID=A0ABM9NLH2_9GAMM